MARPQFPHAWAWGTGLTVCAKPSRQAGLQEVSAERSIEALLGQNLDVTKRRKMVELVVMKKKAVRNAAPVVDDESIDIEGLGVFYLGRKVDPDSGKPTLAPLLVDARRFTTHAVCVGMTGSGGICKGAEVKNAAAEYHLYLARRGRHVPTSLF